MKLKILALSVMTFVFPLVAAAAGAATNVFGLLSILQNILNALIPVIITIAVIYFFWGLTMYITKASEEKEKGRDIMIYGIIAIFIMVSIWGFIGILQSSLVGSGTAPTVPTF